MDRRLLNLFLFVALGLLIVALLFVEREPEQQSNALIDLPEQAINRIEIHNTHKTERKRVVMIRRHDHWMLHSPVQARVDDFEINRLLNLASLNSKQRFLAARMPLDELGLEKPKHSIFFNEDRIDFGNLEPVSKKRYVLSGLYVYLLDKKQATLPSGDWTQFISQRVVPEDFDLVGLSLPELALIKDENGWSALPADEDDQLAAKQLAERWLQAKALWVLEPPDSAHKLGLVKLHGADRIIELQMLDIGGQFALGRKDMGRKTIGLAWAMPAKTRQTLFELYPETDPENEPETGDDGSSSMEPAEPQEPVIGLIEGSQLNHGREPGA